MSVPKVNPTQPRACLPYTWHARWEMQTCSPCSYRRMTRTRYIHTQHSLCSIILLLTPRWTLMSGLLTVSPAGPPLHLAPQTPSPGHEACLQLLLDLPDTDVDMKDVRGEACEGGSQSGEQAG